MGLSVQKRDFKGTPVTRQDYLHLAYFGEIPDPWTAEHEADMPIEPQDWSRFE
jgi:hypothetical protein